jgi:hypothetical protein
MPKEPSFTCASCDIVIAHHPTFHLGLAFCCAGCAADGPCMCTYDTGETAAAGAPIEAFELVPVSVGQGLPQRAAAARG